MSVEMKSQQIEMLIRFFNMQAGASFRVGRKENREAVSGAIDRANGDIVAIKNFVREWASAHKDDEVSVIDCFDAFKKEEPAPAHAVEEVQAQPVDLKRISFPIAHTAFSRVIGWDWYSRFPKGRYRFGYGKSLTLHRKFKSDWAKKMFGDNAILIGAKMLIKQDEKYIEEVFTKCGNSIKA